MQDDVANFAFFMRNSAAPPRGNRQQQRPGPDEFNREGCNGCHVATTFTSTSTARTSASSRSPTSSRTTWGRWATGSATTATRWRHAADANGAAVGRPLPQRPAARRPHHRQGPAIQAHAGQGSAAAARSTPRLGAAERPAAVPVALGRSRTATSLSHPRAASSRGDAALSLSGDQADGACACSAPDRLAAVDGDAAVGRDRGLIVLQRRARRAAR